MSDRDHARLLLDLAARELRALEGMCDRSVFDDWILGFHAQQAAEKALKGWPSALGESYPRTHDLKRLLDLIEGAVGDAAPWRSLVALNAFAVQLRYDTPDVADPPIDRAEVLGRLGQLLDRVRERASVG